MAFTVNPVPFQWVKPTNAMSPALTNGSIGEKSAQTFKDGTPLTLSTGYYSAWGGAAPTAAPVIVGISLVAGLNLSSSGVVPPGSFGTVPNQSSAINAYMTGPVPTVPDPFYKSLGNRFKGLFGTTGANTLPAITDIGVQYGLTKDAGTGYWYVDKAKTAANDVAVTVVGIDPLTSQQGTSITTASLVEFEILSTVAIPS